MSSTSVMPLAPEATQHFQPDRCRQPFDVTRPARRVDKRRQFRKSFH
jgi:hypothetical protein